MKKSIKTLSFENVSMIFVVKFGILLTIASLAPMVGNQLITGIIVNTVLFVSTFILGFFPAIFIAFIPSFIALVSGILPFAFFSFIPFIVVSNVILVLTFHYFKSEYWLAIILSSFFKFVFLFLTSYLIVKFFLGEKTGLLVGNIMTWPQFFTAIFGGIIAYFVLKKLKKM